MEEEPMSVNTTSEITDTAAEKPQEQPTKIVTREEFNRIKHAQKTAEKLAQKQQKNRTLRWKSPFANSKIEDILLISKGIEEFQTQAINALNSLTYELYILQETLLKAGVITKEAIDEVRVYEQQRSAKFNELKEDKTMTKEEKLKIALEWKIDEKALGLTEDVEDISIPAEQT